MNFLPGLCVNQFAPLQPHTNTKHSYIKYCKIHKCEAVLVNLGFQNTYSIWKNITNFIFLRFCWYHVLLFSYLKTRKYNVFIWAVPLKLNIILGSCTVRFKHSSLQFFWKIKKCFLLNSSLRNFKFHTEYHYCHHWEFKRCRMVSLLQ